jgi:hypothetical protein
VNRFKWSFNTIISDKKFGNLPRKAGYFAMIIDFGKRRQASVS